jgi:hypothetical protein
VRLSEHRIAVSPHGQHRRSSRRAVAAWAWANAPTVRSALCSELQWHSLCKLALRCNYCISSTSRPWLAVAMVCIASMNVAGAPPRRIRPTRLPSGGHHTRRCSRASVDGRGKRWKTLNGVAWWLIGFEYVSRGSPKQVGRTAGRGRRWGYKVLRRFHSSARPSIDETKHVTRPAQGDRHASIVIFTIRRIIRMRAHRWTPDPPLLAC